MAITLNTGITHATDTEARLVQIGINYDTGRVMFRLRLSQTGEIVEYFVGAQPGDIDTIAGLVAAFPGFGNLRTNLEQYIAGKVAALAGSVS